MKPSLLLLLSAAVAPAQTTLSLKEAVEQALAGHPALQAGAGRVTASEGQRVQAGLRPNPRFVFQTENLRAHGTPPFSFSQDADTFAYVNQPLETAGKRARRVDVAEAGINRARLEQELLRRLIAARVKQSYWRAAGARKVVDLLRENGRTFQQIVEYHQIRVREGAMAEADLLRVRLESDRLAIAANTAALEAERDRIQLLREMGRGEFPDVVLTDPLESPPPAGVDASEARALEERLEVRIARQSVDRARAVLRLEQAAAKPDVDAILGYKRNSGFNTLMGGVQVELPWAKRNQGNIAAAAAEVKVAEAEMAAYREGGTDLLRLLDAERLRVDAELLYYQTLTQYRQSEAGLEVALGVAP